MSSNSTALQEGPVADPLAFTATDVTTSRVVDFSGVDGYRTASELATSIAATLELPENTPYALRDNNRGRMLRDDVSVGSQLPAEGSELTLVPKSHLGQH